jgi:hypothetical protein
MKPSFSEVVDLSRAVKVTLNEEDIKKVESFVNRIISKKKSEFHHKIDGHNEFKRWTTGIGGEIALEKLIDKSFVDLSIGNSNDFHVPDLKSIGINAGVKTVEYGKFPIIFKKSYKPEIMVIKKDDHTFYVCGVADVDVLNKYQSEDLVLSPSLLARGTKTGFYGFQHLRQFSNYSELKNNI